MFAIPTVFGSELVVLSYLFRKRGVELVVRNGRKVKNMLDGTSKQNSARR